MKKLTSTLIVLVLLCSHAKLYAQSGDTFKSWGEDTFTAIKRDLSISGSNLYRENMGTQNIAFNWPQGIQLHALIAAKKTAEARALADEIHQKYWCNYNGRWGYNASANSCGDRYYDDNAWIAKALMELYLLTNDVTYLNRSKDVIAFSMSGANKPTDTPNGGIRWHEGDAGECVCATAPTTVTNLQIYEATGDTKYLNDAKTLYAYMRANTFLLGPGHRGYENAVVAQAAIHLYKITGESHYYDDAKHMGIAMETVYIDWNNHALHETGQWGGHDMSAVYVDLYNLDKDINWLNIAAGFLSFLHDKTKDGAGRYPEDWSLAGGPASDGLLYQASAARGYALLGNTPGGTPKYPDPVAIFKECNYAANYSAGLAVGKYTAADLDFLGMPDKSISSVKVLPGYKITFYLGDNFTGNSLVKTSDTSCLVNDGFNDNVKSLVVEAIVPGTIMYRDCNFTGKGIHLPVGDYDMFALNARGIGNDDISSLTVSAGYEIVVYQNYNFTGDSAVLSGDNSCLINNGVNDWISSARVRPKLAVSDITNLAGGKITSQYNDSPAGEGITNLIDNNTNTKYLTVHTSAWVQYQSPSTSIVNSYTLTSANDTPERDPLSWTLQGSNNGSSWTTLDSQSNEDFPNRFQTRTFYISNAVSYIYYRFNLNNNSGTMLQLAEFELFGTAGTATSSVGSSSAISSKSSSSSVASSKTSSIASSIATSSTKSSVASSSASSTASACAGIVQYVNGGNYATGAVVKNVGNKYRCDVGGWCTIGGPYEPGVGWAWTNAWTQTGTCQ